MPVFPESLQESPLTVFHQESLQEFQKLPDPLPVHLYLPLLPTLPLLLPVLLLYLLLQMQQKEPFP